MPKPTSSSVAIIGRGIAGLSCAFRFAQLGFDITVFGPKATKDSATRIATGMSTIKGRRLADQSLFKAKALGHQQLHRLIAEVETLASMRIMHGGVYEPFTSAREYQQISEKVYRRQFRGLFGNELCHLPAGAKPKASGALCYPLDFFFDPNDLLDGIEHYLKQQGVRFEQQQVHKISPGSLTGCLTVITSTGDNSFDEVVLAAGSASASILSESGFSVSNLATSWGECAVTEDDVDYEPLGFTKLGACATQIGKIRRCGASSLAQAEVTESNIKQSRIRLEEVYRQFFEQPRSKVRYESGLRLRTKSRHPLVGQIWFDTGGDYRLRLATAFHKNGLQLADLAACFHVSHVIDPNYRSSIFPDALSAL